MKKISVLNRKLLRALALWMAAMALAVNGAGSATPSDGPLAAGVTAPQEAPPLRANIPAAVNAGSATDMPSVYLNGASYVGISHPDVPDLGGGELILEAWIYPAIVSGCHAVFGKEYFSGFWFGVCDGRLRFHRGSAAFVQSSAALPIPAFTWTHIAVQSVPQQDGSFETVFYINGEADGYYTQTGNGVIGGTRNLRIGDDQAWDYFVGDIAEARLRTSMYTPNDLRRDMYVAMESNPGGLAHPGVVAVWHLTGDFRDAIGAMHGTPSGMPLFTGFRSPAQPPTSPVDEFFNVLPAPTFGAAAAYVPRLNRALLVGGYRGGAPSNLVTAVDAGSGESSGLGALPLALGMPAIAYAESNDTVYVFGGGTDYAATTVDTIYAVNPDTGAVRTVAAALPQSLYIGSAVYLPRQNKIIIAGGYRVGPGALDTVYVFDVASETIATAAFALPQPAYGMAAAASSATGHAYLFGGTNVSSVFTAIWDIGLYDDGVNGVVTELASPLPAADARQFAFEDPISKLIYVAGGGKTGRLLALDPLTSELWLTPMELPKEGISTAAPYTLPAASKVQPYAAAIYSPRNRHGLVFGGGSFGTPGTTAVWRIPAGDGPMTQLGRWDFLGQDSAVTSIDGSAMYLIVGKLNGAKQYFDYLYGNGTAPVETTYANAAGFNLVRWDPARQQPYLASDGSVYVGGSGGGTSLLFGAVNCGTPNVKCGVRTLEPAGIQVPLIGLSGVGDPGNVQPLRVPAGSSNAYVYQAFGPACSIAPAVRNKGLDFATGATDFWAITYPGICGPNLAAPAPLGPAAPQYTAATLRRLRVALGGTWTEANLGTLCDSAQILPRALAFGRNGDLWLAGDGGVCRYPAANLPGSANPQPRIDDLPYAVNADAVSVDADGRIWISTDGGLSAYEVRSDGPVSLQGLRTQDWSRLNAPIGNAAGASALGSVAAVGEKVYAGRGPTVFSLSQRWQQLDTANGMAYRDIRRLWTARGRLFVSTNDALHALAPDGATWDTQTTPANDVMADRRGRIWVAHAGGASWWAPGGAWQPVLDLGLSEPVHALAEDGPGRVWLGLDHGVALYDRDRLIARLQPPTGAVSVTHLLADRNGALWAAAETGVARLDPDSDEWTLFDTAGGGIASANPDANHVSDIAERNDGRIYISTAAGVFARSPGESAFAYVAGPVNGAPLATDELGRVWAGQAVENAGNAWQHHYWTNSGLRTSKVNDVASDKADRVWFAHPGGGISVRGAFLPPLAEESIQIDDITPASGSSGDLVTITGSGFGSDINALQVTIGGADARVESVSGTSIKARLQSSNLTGNVSVRRGKRKQTKGTPAQPFFCATPKIGRITPQASLGAEIEVVGSNFDPGALVRVGAGIARASFGGPDKISAWLEPGDTAGSIQVTNRCPARTASSAAQFKRVNLTLEWIGLSQGLPNQPLLYARPTVIRAVVRRDLPRVDGERVPLDRYELTFTNSGTNENYTYSGSLRVTSAGTTSPAGIAAADPNQTLNLPNINLWINPSFRTGFVTARLKLYSRDNLMGEAATEQVVRENFPLRVLLIPIMRKGYQPGELAAVKADVNNNTDDLKRRLFPLGDVELDWSDGVNVIESETSLNLGDPLALYKMSAQLARTRNRYNDATKRGAQVAFGIVQTTTVTGNKSGYGFWPDASSLLNDLALDKLDQLCDLGNAALRTVTLGFLGSSDGCHLDIPLYIAWATHSATSSSLIGHELGHVMGLVKPWAPNGIRLTNIAHSDYDELDNGECRDGGASYTFEKSLYRSSGTTEPILNPISGRIFAPNPGGLENAERAKAIMSYACARKNDNVFFEMSDWNYVRSEAFGIVRDALSLVPRGGFAPAARRPSAPSDAPLPRPRFVSGARLSVSGLITREAGLPVSASFESVETLSEDAPLGVPYVSDYTLVQRDGGGGVLAEDGVLPVFGTSDGENPVGFFGATILRAPGIATLELRHKGALLASFAAGATPPDVALTSPIAGADVVSGALSVAWTASDPDGDVVDISVLYSADDGATWKPVASASGSGAVDVPVALLAGSAAARVRVVAGDGFTATVRTSGAFTVHAQAPVGYISQPVQPGAQVLEGREVLLRGGADDNQDGPLSGAALRWISSRDGQVGTGTEARVRLSAGAHLIVLESRNSAGLTSLAYAYLTVVPDYDGDGLPDSQESSIGTNLLNSRDALSDADGDGLPLITELERGTNPALADTDGDGRGDGEEVADGSDALVSDMAVADALTVSPMALTFTVDLSRDTAIPQQFVQILNAKPATWTLSAEVSWVGADAQSGLTPAQATVALDPIQLREGAQFGQLTVTVDGLGSVVLPMTVTVTGKAGFCDANRDGALNVDDVAAVEGFAGAVVGQPGYDFHADLNRDGVIDTQDRALATACLIEVAPAGRAFLPNVAQPPIVSRAP